MSVCKPRKQNLNMQRIVDDFLFGKGQKGYLDPKYFTFNLSKKQFTLKIGVINFNFKFDKKLGSGTYGTVSSYKDPVNNVYIAIKESEDDEDKISNALLNSNCNTLRSRALGKIGKGRKNRIYAMELAEGDLLNLAYSIKKPTSVHFIFNIVEQIRKQMICIYELTPNHCFMYTDMKLINVLYKCDNPEDLNTYRVFIGDLGGAVPTQVGNTYSFITTYPPLPRRSLVGINNRKEQLDFMSWQLGVLLLLMRVFLSSSISKEITSIDKYFYHMNLPSNPSFLEKFKKKLRDTYDPYRSEYQIAKGFSFANYLDMTNRNSPYDKIAYIDSGYKSFNSTDSSHDYFQAHSQPSSEEPQNQPPVQPPKPPTQPQQDGGLSPPVMDIKKRVQLLNVVQLKSLAKELGCSGYSTLKRADLEQFVINCFNKKQGGKKKSPTQSAHKGYPTNTKREITKAKLELLKVVELKQTAKNFGCTGYSKLQKNDLIKAILKCIKKSPTKQKKPKSPNLMLMTVEQLKKMASKLGCNDYKNLKKADLVKYINKCKAKK